jgi:hypothetical protein
MEGLTLKEAEKRATCRAILHWMTAHSDQDEHWRPTVTHESRASSKICINRLPKCAVRYKLLIKSLQSGNIEHLASDIVATAEIPRLFCICNRHV